MIALLFKKRKFLGMDSGPMHLAELSGISTTVLSGPTNEKIWGPNETEGRVIQKENIEEIKIGEVLKNV